MNPSLTGCDRQTLKRDRTCRPAPRPPARPPARCTCTPPAAPASLPSPRLRQPLAAQRRPAGPSRGVSPSAGRRLYGAWGPRPAPSARPRPPEQAGLLCALTPRGPSRMLRTHPSSCFKSSPRSARTCCPFQSPRTPRLPLFPPLSVQFRLQFAANWGPHPLPGPLPPPTSVVFLNGSLIFLAWPLGLPLSLPVAAELGPDSGIRRPGLSGTPRSPLPPPQPAHVGAGSLRHAGARPLLQSLGPSASLGRCPLRNASPTGTALCLLLRPRRAEPSSTDVPDGAWHPSGTRSIFKGATDACADGPGGATCGERVIYSEQHPGDGRS